MRLFRRIGTMFFTLLFTIALLHTAGYAADDVSFKDYYAYDKGIPLNATVKKFSETPKYIVYSVDYDSVRDMRVTALLMVPKTPGRHACFVFGHGFGGTKMEIMSYAEEVSKRNLCLMTIDMQYSGDRSMPNRMMYSKQLYNSRDALHESVLDLRRAVDFLQTRKEADPKKIGFVGGSMGGIVGGVLCGVEPRIAACVLAVGGADWGYLIKHSIVSHALQLVYGKDRVSEKDGRTILGPTDPINFAQFISPRPLLMLNAINDSLVNPQSNMILFARAGAPKKIVWHATGHELPHEAVLDEATEWFQKYLVRGEKPDFTSKVEGWKTDPLPMPEIKLPPVRTGMSFEEYYGYNRNLPFDTATKTVEAPAIVRATQLRFVSTYDRIVTATLYVPADGKGPFPVVVVQGGTDDGEAGTMLAESLSRAGIAAAVTQFVPAAGREKPTAVGHVGVIGYPYHLRDVFDQSVNDLRRLADFLETVPDLDAKRMGIAGFGPGAVSATVAGGLDPRFRSAALVDGWGDWSSVVRNSKPAGPGALRGKLTPADAARILAPVDPSRFVSRIAPRPILVAATGDKTAQAASRVLFDRAGKPKSFATMNSKQSDKLNDKLVDFFRGSLK